MIKTKRQEIRERAARIVEMALSIVTRDGLGALSMEAIAGELNMTRGTVYNHYRNKEEIVLALAIHAAEQRLAVFSHAVMIRGTTRQRIAAIGFACEYYADRFPVLMRVEHQIRHDLVWEKTSTERQEILKRCEARCMHAVAGVVRDAVASGDLTLAENRVVEEIVFGLWSLVHGGMLLELTSPSLADVGIRNARRAIRAGWNSLLDGCGWMPLYDPKEFELWAEVVRRDLETIQPLTAAESIGSHCT